MQTLRAYVQLKTTSQPIIYERMCDVYEKGAFVCISYYTKDGIRWTDKYPINNIWRIRQPYEYHSMPSPLEDRQ